MSVHPELETAAELYKRHIDSLVNDADKVFLWPGLRILSDFIGEQVGREGPRAQFTVLDIYDPAENIGTNSTKFQVAEFNELWRLDDFLAQRNIYSQPHAKGTKNPVRGRLFVVENLCPSTIFKLGGAFDVDPQFWADYLENLPWYRITSVPLQLSALPSCQREEYHLRIQTIIPRELCHESSKHEIKDGEFYALADDTTSYAEQDKSSARVKRKSGILKPSERGQQSWRPIAFARQSITVWSRKLNSDGEWIGIILTDPLFQSQKLFHDRNDQEVGTKIMVEGAEFREYHERPSMAPIGQLRDKENNATCRFPTSASAMMSPPSLGISSRPCSSTRPHVDAGLRKRPLISLRKAFISRLVTRLSNSEALQKAALTDIFTLLPDLYLIIASEWLVVNGYTNRELATIECLLERKIPEFKELQTLLQVLFIQRRRTTRYAELISETRRQCHQRGQENWPKTMDGDAAMLTAKLSDSLVMDFDYLHKKFLRTLEGIEKTIDLLTALVTIGEAEQALAKTQGVARLTVVAALYLPFSTVAAVMAIPGPLGPGQKNFWVYWACSAPMALLLLVLLQVYGWIKPKYVKHLSRASWKAVSSYASRRKPGAKDKSWP